MARPPISLSGFAGGSIAGLTMAFSMLLVTLVLGGAELIIDGEAAHAYLPYVIPLGGCLLVASLAEEWLFRGYPLTKLSEAFGRGWANLSLEEIQVPGVTLVFNRPDIVSGGAFGPEAGIGATVATVLVLGMLVVYFRRRGAADLPLPLGRRDEGIGTTG